MEKLRNKQIELKNLGGLQVLNWVPKDGLEIYSHLESLNWAPWLEASPKTLSSRAGIFPEGHLIIKNSNSEILATLSTNRINWNCDLTSLPCWDDVAGEPTDYSKTYNPEGNTLVLMSMNVNPHYQGKGLAQILIKEIKNRAIELGIKNLIGSFRPNEYGEFKSCQDNWQVDFEDYCKKSREDGWPLDSWLRNLIRNGMEPLLVDRKAMTVTVSIGEFELYKSIYNIGKWKEVKHGIWECGEVGQWIINNDTATYQESNLWGKF